MPYSEKSGQVGPVPASRFMSPLRLILCMAAVALLAACADTRGGSIPYNPQGFEAPDPVQVTRLEDDYKIAPLDTLHVNVFQVADLTGDYDVDLTGTISMPLIGSVKAVDLTTKQLDDEITQRLSEKYLQHPDVSIAVKSSSTRNVTVTGSVKEAGVFPVTGRLSLMQVVALAHGPDDNANPRRVAVFRTVKGQRMAAAFDLTSIGRGQMQDPPVYAGDIVVVDGSKVKSAWTHIIQSIPIIAVFHPLGI
ncbi:MAG TPA: polysaccharide biosynthesis/export family protein [Allosphingosinicella sp.]